MLACGVAAFAVCGRRYRFGSYGGRAWITGLRFLRKTFMDYDSVELEIKVDCDGWSDKRCCTVL